MYNRTPTKFARLLHRAPDTQQDLKPFSSWTKYNTEYSRHSEKLANHFEKLFKPETTWYKKIKTLIVSSIQKRRLLHTKRSAHRIATISRCKQVWQRCTSLSRPRYICIQQRAKDSLGKNTGDTKDKRPAYWQRKYKRVSLWKSPSKLLGKVNGNKKGWATAGASPKEILRNISLRLGARWIKHYTGNEHMKQRGKQKRKM